MAATIAERVAEFYRRLQCLPPAGGGREAWQQLCRTLEEVEDELSGMRKSDPPPPPGRPDGRMYPPLEDFVVRAADGSLMASTRGHRIEIDAGGGIRITNRKSNVIEFEKRGAHG
jgi:hypothetical protein